MKFRPRQLAVLLALVLALPACERSSSPTGPLAESVEAPRLPQATTIPATDGQTYTLVEAPAVQPPAGAFLLTKVIGLLGGELKVLGNTLQVPAGAVLQPTIFSMEAVQDGHLHVELLAYRIPLLGGLIDIGALGFNKPVKLRLDYSRATNVTDPSTLRILRLPATPGGLAEPVPTVVDTQKKEVRAELDHFSGYIVAM